MDIIRRNKILTWIVGILLILNFSIIGLLWLNSRSLPNPVNPNPSADNKIVPSRSFNRSPGRGMEGRIYQELELNNEQIKLYRGLKRQHMQTVHTLLDSIRYNKQQIHVEVFKPDPDVERIENLADSIGDLNARLERLNYLHFLQLKNNLTPEQVVKFEQFMREMPFNKRDRGNRHQHGRRKR